jgi:hypothetical protein
MYTARSHKEHKTSMPGGSLGWNSLAELTPEGMVALRSMTLECKCLFPLKMTMSS